MRMGMCLIVKAIYTGVLEMVVGAECGCLCNGIGNMYKCRGVGNGYLRSSIDSEYPCDGNDDGTGFI